MKGIVTDLNPLYSENETSFVPFYSVYHPRLSWTLNHTRPTLIVLLYCSGSEDTTVGRSRWVGPKDW